MTSLHKPENVAQIIVKKEAWPLSPEDLRILAKRPVAEFKTDNNVVMDDFRSAILEAADALERLQTPYCLGRTTIETVADEGQLALDSGHAFIAASDLFKHNPYTEIDRLNAELAHVVG